MAGRAFADGASRVFQAFDINLVQQTLKMLCFSNGILGKILFGSVKLWLTMISQSLATQLRVELDFRSCLPLTREGHW